MPPANLRKDQSRITRAELVRREVAAMLFVGAALVLLSAFRPAPIAASIVDMGTISGEVKAPWFFLWVQQLLKWGDPFVLGVVVPVALLAALAAIPYILPGPAAADRGRWFPKSARAAEVFLAVVAVAVIALTVVGWLTAP